MYEFNRFPERKNTDSIKWDAAPEGVIPMWVADMDFPAAPPIVQAVQERTAHPIYGYPDEQQDGLRELVVKHYQKTYGIEVLPEWIVWIPSVISGMVAALQMVGKTFLYSIPMYNHIRMLTKEAGLPVIEVPMKRRDMYYTLDMEAMEQALTPEVKTVILCNPHNPVGRVLQKEELLLLQEFCDRHGLLLISDEIHCELDLENRHIPYFSLNEQAAKHSITLCSAGKICNIPGLPMGFAIIPEEELRNRMIRQQDGRLPAHNVVTLAAYKKAYDGSCDAWKKELREYLKGNRDYLEQRLAAFPGILATHNEGTYLSWLDCSGLGLEDPCDFFLKKARVMLSPGALFGDPQSVRLNFACPKEQLAEVLDRMEKAVSDLKR